MAPVIEREILQEISSHCGDRHVVLDSAFDAASQALTGETFVFLLVPATSRSIQLPSLLQNLSNESHLWESSLTSARLPTLDDGLLHSSQPFSRSQ